MAKTLAWGLVYDSPVGEAGASEGKTREKAA
jgi:hypothetical protein